MKKLIALLAVIGFVPTAYAADGADITWNGEYRLQYTNDMNADLDDDAPDSPNQSWAQRSRLGVTARAGEKMTFHSMLVHNTNFGANADQTPDTTLNTDGAGAETQNTDNQLLVNEAYMSWMIREDLMMKVGRGSATIADGRVVSANDYEPVAKAFDGALFAWMHERVDVKAFGVWGATGRVSATNAGNNIIGRFYGVSADLKSLPDFLKTAHLHYIMVKRDEGTYTVNGSFVALPKEDTSRIGLTVGGDAAGVDYRLTYAMYQGDIGPDAASLDVDASMMDAEVGYAIPAAMNMRVHLGYHTDSGDDDAGDDKLEEYSGFHYDTHNNAGLMDLATWGNLTYQRVGVSFNPADDINVAAEYFMFTQTEDDDANGEDELGTELDLTVTKKYGSNFTTSASYRTFAAGDDLGTDLDDNTQFFLEGKLTF